MNIIEIKTEVRVFDKPSELSIEQQALLKAAAIALQQAYAPYSKFKVGSALLLDNGKIIAGSNQENASSPVGLCAERVALANKAANFPKEKIKAVAVSVEKKQGEIARVTMRHVPASFTRSRNPTGFTYSTFDERFFRQGVFDWLSETIAASPLQFK